MAKFVLYIAERKTRRISMEFPKSVSNKVTKRPGTANITIHKKINKVIKPTTKLRFLRENIPCNDKDMFIYYISKKN